MGASAADKGAQQFVTGTSSDDGRLSSSSDPGRLTLAITDLDSRETKVMDLKRGEDASFTMFQNLDTFEKFASDEPLTRRELAEFRRTVFRQKLAKVRTLLTLHVRMQKYNTTLNTCILARLVQPADI